MLSQHVTGRKAERMQNPQARERHPAFWVAPARRRHEQRKPNGDPRQQTDWKNTKQTDQPWKGPAEKEQSPDGPPPDLEKWHETNTR
jgi:hypothetical protein